MQFNSYVFVISALLIANTIVLFDTLKNLDKKAAKELAVMLSTIITGLIFFNASLIIKSSPLKIITHELKFLGIAFYSPSVLFFFLRFAGIEISKWKKVGCCIIPAVAVILAITNRYHHLFRRNAYIFTHNGSTFIAVENNIFYVVYTVYSYTLIFVSFLLLISEHYKKPRAYRDQTGLIFYTGLTAVTVSLLASFGIIDDVADIAVIAFSTAALLQYFAIVKYTPAGIAQPNPSYITLQTLAGHPGAIPALRNIVIRDINNPVLIFDHNLLLVDANKSAAYVLGVKSGDYGVLQLDKFVDDKKINDGEHFFEKEKKYFNVSDKSIYEENGNFAGRLLVFNDITDLKISVQELEMIAKKDYLTGIGNRVAFYEVALALSESELPTAFVMLNINQTKMMNDIFGFEYGDKMICAVGKELDKECSGNNICARMDGDEFCVLLKNTALKQAETFVEDTAKNLSRINIGISAHIEMMYNIGQEAEHIIHILSDRINKEKGLDRDYGHSFMLEELKNRIGDKSFVTTYSLKIAKKMNIEESEVNKLTLLCMIHDIGLLSLPEQIIKSIGNLTNEQWDEVKRHTIRGHNIAVGNPEFRFVAKEILHHHERFDGFGYPHRLKGAEIPLLSRILAVSEFYESNQDDDDLVDRLRKCKNKQFDPDVVEALIGSFPDAVTE